MFDDLQVNRYAVQPKMFKTILIPLFHLLLRAGRDGRFDWEWWGGHSLSPARHPPTANWFHDLTAFLK